MFFLDVQFLGHICGRVSGWWEFCWNQPSTWLQLGSKTSLATQSPGLLPLRVPLPVPAHCDDYRCWWTSFSGIFVLYSLMYLKSRLQIRHWVSVLMHFGYMTITSCIFRLISGAVGWKLVHGDVFRKPNYSTFLSVMAGSGMQLLGMSVVTLIFALLGFLSPAQRGSLLQSMMLLFTLMGVLGGYTAARLCKVFDGDEGRWKTTTMLQAFLVPGLFFGIFFLLNLCIWGQKAGCTSTRDCRFGTGSPC
eukprot:s3725_g4.t1